MARESAVQQNPGAHQIGASVVMQNVGTNTN
jgi:hypothetical protein